MQVTIDGVPYVPVCNSGARISIANTTPNRPTIMDNLKFIYFFCLGIFPYLFLVGAEF